MGWLLFQYGEHLVSLVPAVLKSATFFQLDATVYPILFTQLTIVKAGLLVPLKVF